MNASKTLLPPLLLCAALGCGVAPPPADLVVHGERVWTGNVASPWAEAVASRGEEIVAVGSFAEVRAFIGDETRVLDVAGQLVVPGFIDTHVHFIDGGFGLSSVQLRDAATPEEFARRIGDFAATVDEGTWILNGNWDHERWGGELPHRDWIDELTRRHPVFISRLDGHMALANTAALEAAGVLAGDRETDVAVDVEGGEAVRDGGGRLTGVLKDNAMLLVQSVIPAPPKDLEDRALDAASQHVLARGVTTVHHMGTWNDLAIFERARDAGRLTLGVSSCVPLEGWERLAEKVRSEGTSSGNLRIGCLKGMVDGSLGSHTALFLEPYTDTPDSGTGLYVMPTPQIEEHARGADAAGLQVNVHAIGDRAIRELLDAFGRIAQENGAKDRRFRVEHAQHIHPDDVSRFAGQGVIASMHPYHAIDDGRWAEGVIGPRRSLTTYAFRSLLDTGARVAFGSDWAVAPPTPLEGIYAAVTRQTLDGDHPDGWVPREKITVEEALRAYTSTSAFAGFEDDTKGTLEVGKRADLVVIDRNLLELEDDPQALRDARVTTTVVGGEVVFEGGSRSTEAR